MCVYITHKYYTESEFNTDLCQLSSFTNMPDNVKNKTKNTVHMHTYTQALTTSCSHTHTHLYTKHKHTYTHRGKETGKTGHPEYHHRHLLSVLDSLAVTENKADASIYATVSQSVIYTQCIQSLTAKLWDHHSQKIKYICNQHYKR